MAKYIDADLLRKDIDNWKEAMADAIGEYSDGVRFALEHFTFVLDSLQHEQPEESDKSLEKEVKRYISKDNSELWEGDDDYEYTSVPLCWTKDFARHFAKWGAERAKIDVTDFCKPIDPGIAQCIADHSWEMLGEDEKPVPNSLEEAANEFANQDCVTFISRKKGFIAGAKWQKQHDAELIEIAYNDGITIGMTKQKEQMLKEAVEGEILLTPYPTIGLDDCKDYDFKDGQKGRIIILPKED